MCISSLFLKEAIKIQAELATDLAWKNGMVEQTQSSLDLYFVSCLLHYKDLMHLSKAVSSILESLVAVKVKKVILAYWYN